MSGQLCQPSDVIAKLVRPLSDFESTYVNAWIDEASAQLRQRAPFDIDARIAMFDSGVVSPAALDPVLVAGVVAGVVKNFLVNPEGFVTTSEATGPFSQSHSFVNRYDKSGSDVRGRIQVTDADVDQLRPAAPAESPFSFKVGIPQPGIVLPNALRPNAPFGAPSGPVAVPDPRYADLYDRDDGGPG